MLPDGQGLAAGRVRRRDEGGGGRAGPRDHRRARARRRRPPAMKLTTTRRTRRSIWKVREAGLGATAFIPGEPDTCEGWEDSAVPPERLGDVPARAASSCSTGTATRARSTATSVRAACTRASNFDLRQRGGHRDVARASSTRPPTWSSRYGGSLSGEHGDGQSRAELLPKMFGDRAGRGVPRVQGDLGSRRTDEPRQGRRPLSDRLRTCSSAPGYRPPQVDDPLRLSRTTAAASPTRPLRCVGVGKCRRTRRAA